MLHRPGSSGVEAEPGGKTRWAHSVVALCLCYRRRVSVSLGAPPPARPLPASAVSRDLLFVNGSSWAAAMSCQAALRLRALYSAHMRGPAEAARANITSLSGQKIRPTHSKKQAPPFTQTAWGSEIRKTLIWTMGTLSALNPGCPPLEINYV